ncbi:hypothetical protein B0T22DRAFT_438711 [Podospora appendiculata]|uniref:Ankyrin n=1 Tax=Podospora appendiculata TaxID=314037 RepID=A0AAE0XLV4_9PEZI|nr:hypothetical protein B0T22DRAFT_438711 [Podospora appendiculata]
MQWPIYTKIVDPEGNTLLHLIGNPELNHNAASSFTSWEDIVEACKQVVHLLISSGLDVEAHNDAGQTPLHTCVLIDKNLSSARRGWATGHAIIALLDAGAEIDVRDSVYMWRDGVFGKQISASILDLWAATEAQTPQFPAAYDDVLRYIVSKAPKSLNALRGGQTVLHKLLVTFLWLDAAHVGLTPLLDLLGSYSMEMDAHRTISLAGLLLDQGACLESVAVSPKGVLASVSPNGVSVIALIHATREWTSEEYRLEVMRWLVDYFNSSHRNAGCKLGHSKLLDDAPTFVLAVALYLGEIRMAAFLMRFGMKSRLNERLEFYRWSIIGKDFYAGSASSLAFCGRGKSGRYIRMRRLRRHGGSHTPIESDLDDPCGEDEPPERARMRYIREKRLRLLGNIRIPVDVDNEDVCEPNDASGDLAVDGPEIVELLDSGSWRSRRGADKDADDNSQRIGSDSRPRSSYSETGKHFAYPSRGSDGSDHGRYGVPEVEIDVRTVAGDTESRTPGDDDARPRDEPDLLKNQRLRRPHRGSGSELEDDNAYETRKLFARCMGLSRAAALSASH